METHLGRVTHYFSHIGVAALSLTGELKLEDILHFSGHNTDLVQKVWSIEVNHQKIERASPGMEIAIRVAEPVHKGDDVFLVTGLSEAELHEIVLSKLDEH